MIFDTYAIIEIMNGNKNYAKYKKVKPLLSRFTLAELAYTIIRKFGRTQAEKYIEKFSTCEVKVDNKTIIDAMTFKHKHKKLKLSITDCIGYSMAKNLGVKFLTGDNQFKNKPNVEFVK